MKALVLGATGGIGGEVARRLAGRGWTVSARMSNARLVAKIGPEPHTPIDEAVRETLIGLSCLSPR